MTTTAAKKRYRAKRNKAKQEEVVVPSTTKLLDGLITRARHRQAATFVEQQQMLDAAQGCDEPLSNVARFLVDELGLRGREILPAIRSSIKSASS